jgi:hypothetical protein
VGKSSRRQRFSSRRRRRPVRAARSDGLSRPAPDRDAAQVAPNATASTISALAAIPAPTHPNLRQDTRFAPVETSIMAVSGILTVIEREKDQDYHLVLAEPQGGLTMIVEAPDPDCAIGSRFAPQIAAVRQTIDARFGGPIRGRRRVEIPVTIVGVAFFDPLHGQEGVAPNGIELHPILQIQFD